MDSDLLNNKQTTFEIINFYELLPCLLSNIAYEGSYAPNEKDVTSLFRS